MIFHSDKVRMEATCAADLFLASPDAIGEYEDLPLSPGFPISKWARTILAQSVVFLLIVYDIYNI